ncbi:hypothetical protein [Neorhodopirellula pilleata]|uniref:Uncharacterized protein n=1 Tax=Neorhodopirellula pilleata TaxID=2714738 RepID=A0A5C6A9B3_9BACT|nr:hypothetical protein [Neorhodopirellula pilleata]TWT94913.1 hypothetical protein Pla100_34860 [Neorhodopirellula pilleata]
MFTVSRSNTLPLRLRFPSQSTVFIAMLVTGGMNDSTSRDLKFKLKRIVSMLTRMAIKFDGIKELSFNYPVTIIATNDDLPSDPIQMAATWLDQFAVAVSKAAAADRRFALRYEKHGIFLFGVPHRDNVDASDGWVAADRFVASALSRFNVRVGNISHSALAGVLI